jgi:hypothetical protein
VEFRKKCEREKNEIDACRWERKLLPGDRALRWRQRTHPEFHWKWQPFKKSSFSLSALPSNFSSGLTKKESHHRPRHVEGNYSRLSHWAGSQFNTLYTPSDSIYIFFFKTNFCAYVTFRKKKSYLTKASSASALLSKPSLQVVRCVLDCLILFLASKHF